MIEKKFQKPEQRSENTNIMSKKPSRLRIRRFREADLPESVNIYLNMLSINYVARGRRALYDAIIAVYQGKLDPLTCPLVEMFPRTKYGVTSNKTYKNINNAIHKAYKLSPEFMEEVLRRSTYEEDLPVVRDFIVISAQWLKHNHVVLIKEGKKAYRLFYYYPAVVESEPSHIWRSEQK